MERGFLFQNPSLSLFSVGTRMPLDEIDLFKEHLLLLRKDLQHPATLSLFLSVDDHDQVILFDMIFWNDHFKFLFTLTPVCRQWCF